MDTIGVNDANGTNNSCGDIDFTVQWCMWNLEDTLLLNGAIGANDTPGSNEVISANVIISAHDSIRAI